MGGKDFKEDINLMDWLTAKNTIKNTPDVYCLGFQEIVPLNAGNLLSITSNASSIEIIKNALANNLQRIDR